MDEVNKIRNAFRDGATKHELATRFNRSWNTIDTIVESSAEEREALGTRRNRKATVVTEKVKSAVRELLKQEQALKVPRKQRYTATFIFQELRRSGVYSGSGRRMRDVVREIRAELKASSPVTFLPLSFEAGRVLHIDHGEVLCEIAGERRTSYLFVGSLPGLALRYCQLAPVKAREAWGEFHERVFRFWGGVFADAVYDNDSVLVKQILGTERAQTDFSLDLERHYGFRSRFCSRGAGHEKGAVENGVGFCRRNYLAGLPSYPDWKTVNAVLEQSCRQAVGEGTHYRTGQPLTELLHTAQTRLAALPPQRQWVRWETRTVDSRQRVTYAQHGYSVPESYVGKSIRVAVGLFHLTVYDGQECIATHPRQYRPGADSLLLDHYLPQLRRKPGAFWDCAAVQAYDFPPEMTALWDRLLVRFTRREATQEFITILLLGRLCRPDELVKAVDLALSYGSVEAAGVAHLLRQMTTEAPPAYDPNWLTALHPELTPSAFQTAFNLDQYASLHEEVSAP